MPKMAKPFKKEETIDNSNDNYIYNYICGEGGNSSEDRIELSIDLGTWGPMDEDMISLDPIEF
ncbi:hypothetical protein J1N35_019418 [Gossypium stocksii]|uniref:Uncharacterized protein n=1 Tax=Gossypium stocksii TaxID=47602 RepID=A0A9D3VQV1_9ROSI|nr:hypothetical protein J1N35_019418 [Gossypium stocksii]